MKQYLRKILWRRERYGSDRPARIGHGFDRDTREGSEVVTGAVVVEAPR
ncbi:MAG: hypothetical protein AB1451_07055 [Nitrospirota bacterium]